MTDFHATRMGQRFFESTIPALVDAIKRLAVALERLAERGDEPEPADPEPKDDDR